MVGNEFGDARLIGLGRGCAEGERDFAKTQLKKAIAAS
jgi:hypothetical protein